MKRLIIDLDETITLSARDGYENAVPNVPLIAKLREYREAGFEIVEERPTAPWGGPGVTQVYSLRLR